MKRTFICSHCGALVPNCNIYRFSGEYLCRDCYDERYDSGTIHEYSYMPEPVFTARGLHKFGVELEIDKGGELTSHAKRFLDIANRHAENLYIKPDGSLDDGLELVTHPMTLEYHLQEMPWEDILHEAKRLGYRSHGAGTCGLHVHISRMAFGCTYDTQEACIARLVYFMEKFWPELLRFSRRHNRSSTVGQLATA